uniref:Fucosyltransferase n=1 Tax=Strongyloides papillosus TaxID=174720 RepID=A0A0N5BDN7_STREA
MIVLIILIFKLYFLWHHTDIIYNYNSKIISNLSFVILSWNAKQFENFGYCPDTDCLYTNDRSYLKVANAIFFNDYFYNPFKDGSNVIKRSKISTLFVNVITESYANMINKPFYWLLNYPHNYFNLTYTYLANGDVFWSYGSDRWYFRNLTTTEKYNLSIELENKLSKKNKNILWIVSNCNAISGRSIAIGELNKYLDVEQFGECNNKKLSLTFNEKRKLYEEYYFYIASENSDCKDYITEKFYERILFTSIPLVNVRSFYAKDDIPPNSFIAFDDFASPKEMADYLKFLISNKTEYIKYFAYRKDGWFQRQYNDYRCYTCRKFKRIYKNNRKNNIFDIKEWFKDNNYCLKENYIPEHWNLR